MNALTRRAAGDDGARVVQPDRGRASATQSVE
jgi:hypothetical protein